MRIGIGRVVTCPRVRRRTFVKHALTGIRSRIRSTALVPTPLISSPIRYSGGACAWATGKGAASDSSRSRETGGINVEIAVGLNVRRSANIAVVLGPIRRV